MPPKPIPTSTQFFDIPLNSITVFRKERQRQVIELSTLVDSIRTHGLLQPIIVRDKRPDEDRHIKRFILVAGERRFEAVSQLGWSTIPAFRKEQLDSFSAQILEFVENIERHQLPWQDEVRAVGNLHKMKKEEGPWTQAKTAELVGRTKEYIQRSLRVYADLHDPRVQACGGLDPAHSLLTRIDQRRVQDAMNTLSDMSQDVFAEAEGMKGEQGTLKDSSSVGFKKAREIRAALPTLSELRNAPKPISEKTSILQEDFLEWAPKYQGERFNLIHCDFPYGGVNVFGGKFGRGRGATTDLGNYSNSPELFWACLDTLTTNLSRLATPNAHIMMWFSMDYYAELVTRLTRQAPVLNILPFPLIWHKSDNSGIIPDPRRRPRHIYETALLCTLGDRFIIEPVADHYSAPTNKQYHIHTKPEPVLGHFFRMFVDNETRLLDPTCGSGSALRAAEKQGARFVLGLEHDPENCQAARIALKQFRQLRKAYAIKGKLPI